MRRTSEDMLTVRLPVRPVVCRAAALGVCLAMAAAGCGRKAAEPGPTLTTNNSPSTTSTSTPAVNVSATDDASESVGSALTKSRAYDPKQFVPDWATDAIFYQIFPERFRNGDASNDPTRQSLEDPDKVPDSWEVSPWTGDWYVRAEWEEQTSDGFYEAAVFNRRYGGDLQGILDKLDYVHDLGVNAIYLNPVFYARSLHKYDGASMHHIDPYFGPDPQGDFQLIASESSDPETWQWTAADKLFLELVAEIHRREMRVIIDGVFNHTGRDFFAFADLVEKQAESPYQDWYIVESFDDPQTDVNEFQYKSWWGFESLPEFADDPSGTDLHPGPKEYVMNITRRWMDPNGDGDPADGIDGWRLDVANEVPARFWRDWNTLVRELNPEAYTAGEFWGEAHEQLVDGRFSSTMNYHGFAYLVKGFLIDGKLTPHDFGQQLVARLEKCPAALRYSLLNLIDSHDTDRVASMIVNANRQSYKQPERFDYDVSERVSPRFSTEYDVRRPTAQERRIQRLVALMQMTFVGPPMFYYGTEAGMWGADDPCDRMPMVWNDLQYDDQAADPLGRPREAEPVGFDQELFDFFRAAIELRRESPALRQGTFEMISHDDAKQFFAFRRKVEGQSMLVAINRGEVDFDWQFEIIGETEPKQVFRTADNGELVPVNQVGKTIRLTVPALDALVLTEASTRE